MRVKNCALSSSRRPPWVQPCSGQAKIRSISEEKFSSPPPSLPMPKISSGCASPCALHGVPHSRQQASYSQSRAATISVSARWLSCCNMLSSVTRASVCAQAMRTIMRRRNSRSSRINPASSLTLLSASCNHAA